MKDFFARHSYLVIWVISLTVIGWLAYTILQLNTYVPRQVAMGPNQPGSTEVPARPGPPPTPTVSFFVQTAPKNATSGNSFIVQWENLPNGTVAINILRSHTGENDWSLWKTVSITSDELGSGSADLNIGNANESGYSLEVEAVSGNGDTTGIGTSTNGNGETVLWESSSTVPVVTSSTPPAPPQPPPQNPSPQNPTSTITSPTSTTSTNEGSGDGLPSSTEPQSPTGIPYYDPQVQITAYGTAPGTFWVSHVNQSIEIGWQNIPVNVDTIEVARSASSTGPWSTIIVQHNPGSSGSYSLQLVDNTLNDPYYYQMTALQGTTTIATYGPAYLTSE